MLLRMGWTHSLPIYALAQEIDVAMIGLFFSVQKFMPMVLKPVGGAIGDRIGYRNAVAIGMLVIGVTLPLIGVVGGGWQLLILALFIGAGQALVFPATVALASHQIDATHMGAGMGLVGTLKNAGKVIGPIVGGLLVIWLDYAPMFQVMGLLLMGSAVGLWMSTQRRKLRGRRRRFKSGQTETVEGGSRVQFSGVVNCWIAIVCSFRLCQKMKSLMDGLNKFGKGKFFVSKQYTAPPAMQIDESKTYLVTMETSAGTIELELYPRTRAADGE